MFPKEGAVKIISQVTLVQGLESQTVRLRGWDYLERGVMDPLMDMLRLGERSKDEVDISNWSWGKWGRVTFQMESN